MKLQELLIQPNEKYSELFFRGNLTLSTGETLTFDTYYNSFCYTKYRDYTIVNEVNFSCRFNGKALIQLCIFDGAEHIIAQAKNDQFISLNTALDKLPENGFLYPKITALTDCVFTGGEYSSECSPANISCCIAICTFKREHFVLKNIKILEEFKFSFIDRVFVIDNGNTLNVSELSDNFINVLPNKNLGGSGGFTRGLIEALDGGYSHIILMDDDVEFIPQKLEQMTVFISLLKKEYSESWFSAAMLTLDKPWEQFELGASYNGNIIHHKYLLDMRIQTNLFDNLNNPKPDYGSWWTLCMPISVTAHGFPFPFFIKFDDIEYGLRKAPDTEIITMNGIGIRHESFDKKENFILDYYNLRNELILNAVYKKCGAQSAFCKFWRKVLKEIFLYRYDNCQIVFRAIEDFLGGVDFFLKCDEEQLNNYLVKIAIKLIPLSEIPQWNEDLRCDNHIKNNKLTVKAILTLDGHLIPAFMLDKNPNVLPLSSAGMADFFNKKEVIQYQLGSNIGILTKRNVGKFFWYFFRGIGVSAKLLFGFKKAQNSLIMRKYELTSVDFWRKHLKI